MSDSKEKKPTPKLEVVSMMSKIMEDKLIGPNCLEWSKTIRIYVRSVRMGGHLTKISKVTLEGLVLEVLFVIIAISLAM